MDNIQTKKNALRELAKTQVTIEAGTQQELRVVMQLDIAVNELLRLGVSEREIRGIIREGQVQGRTIMMEPPFGTRTYLTPAHRREISGIVTDMIQEDEFNNDEHPNAVATHVTPVARAAAAHAANVAQVVAAPNANAAPSWQQLFAQGAAPVVAPNANAAPSWQQLFAQGAAAVVAPTAARATPAMANRYDFLNGEDEELDSKNLDDYKEMMKCSICLTNIKDVRLSPCDHMFCKTCVRALINREETRCPICRVTFNSVNKMYNSKYLKYKIKYLTLKNKNN